MLGLLTIIVFLHHWS